MKRILYFLVLVLMVFSSIGSADAKSRARKEKPKKEQTLTKEGAAIPAPVVQKEKKQSDDGVVVKPGPIQFGAPVELQLKRAASRRFDLRALPQTKPQERERPELEPPDHTPVMVEGSGVHDELRGPAKPATNAPAPPPIAVYEGLDREFWGAGSPPDTTGDVGPVHYIQAVNTSVGVFRKSDGFMEAGFTFDTLMSQGNFGNLCDTDNFGDPVVLYDSFEDRWVLTDFAFTLNAGNPQSPAFQCFAVSMNGDPVAGGWHFYSIQINDFLNDYEKLAVWPDGIYMTANMFGFGAGGTFQGIRAWAFNKMQMYAGSPTVKIVSFNLGSGDFTVVPSNARLQTGTPPPGRPNLLISTWNFLNAVTVYKFHVDWTNIGLSTVTGPDIPLAATSWPNAAVGNAPQPGTATLLDVLQIRAMVQNQYTNFGGTESLWVPHTVRRGNTSGFAAPRWYQVDVTGGTVAANIPQAATWDPDAGNVMHRFMPSLAVDRGGNMAMGYSMSNSTTQFPSIMYAGRLAGDPINTFSQTEQVMFTGTASQTGSTRWGDYSSVMLDPDGCTFWITNEYANPLDQAFDKRWKTKIGFFRYPSCTQVGAGGSVTGTVTETPGGAPLSGATINFGARTTTTNGSGVYSFLNIPAGTYPSITASHPGHISSTALNIVVTDGGTTVQDFSLAIAPTSSCLTDTTQPDFQTGVGTNVDVITNPGNVELTKPDNLDQVNNTVTTSGFGFNSTSWAGQTFLAAISGAVTKAELDLFCSGCTGTTPNLTVAIRATTGSPALPTGADLATATLTGFNTGAGGFFSVTFAAPFNVVAGTRYAVIIRATANPSAGTYAYVCSCTSPNSNPYANGQRVTSANSGVTWAADVTSGGRDLGFRIYVNTGYSPAGNLISAPKDSNPAVGLTPIWSNLSWNAATPVNTSLQFQVAGSSSVNGPFAFVGPDGTGATFFTTSPAALTQFYATRYLEYKAFLATTDGAVTPTLNDVTLCYNDVDCSTTVATITPAPTQVCESSTGNTASGPAGMTSYSWSITNGTITSATNIQAITYDAGVSGNVGLTLSVVASNGCQDTENVNVPIIATPATPTITPDGPTTFCAGEDVVLTSSSATGNQWYLNTNPIGGETNQTLTVTASGNYTVVVTLSGCPSAPSATTAVTVNPLPPTPTITPGGPTTFCTGGSVTLTSSSATGNQWYLNTNPIGGETNQNLVVTASGSYTVVVTDGNSCVSSPSAATVVTVNPIPPQPTITPGGPTTFCAGGSVLLTSSSATGNQWYLEGNPIGGETNQTYSATASGNYTVVVTQSGCASPASAATSVTVNPIPPTPTITPGGPTTFCAGGSVTLTSSSATGNQWLLNGVPIGGETNPAHVASVAGDYTVTVTASGCTSAPSATTTVTINPNPDATITAPGSVVAGSTGNAASVANAGVGATYSWGIVNGTITAGTGTANITFTAGVVGVLTLNVTVTTGAGCSDVDSVNVNVTAAPPPVTVTSVTPTSGSTLGGTNVTIGGTGFNAGASVTFGATAATSIVVVNATQITATTPSHVAGAVNVTVTNTDTTTGTLTNGYTYNQQNFDPNGDSMIDPSDIFYLIAYLFTGGPAPAGTAGMPSGDANGDSVVDPADIFYAVNYLFSSGPPPSLRQPGVSVASVPGTFSGAVTLGRAVQRENRWFVPVIVTMDPGAMTPQAFSVQIRIDGARTDAAMRRGTAAAPIFEVSRRTADAISYLAAFDERAPFVLGASRSAVIAEVELTAPQAARLTLDPALTMLVDGSGTRKATVANRTLRLTGTVINRQSRESTPRDRQ